MATYNRSTRTLTIWRWTPAGLVPTFITEVAGWSVAVAVAAQHGLYTVTEEG